MDPNPAKEDEFYIRGACPTCKDLILGQELEMDEETMFECPDCQHQWQVTRYYEKYTGGFFEPRGELLHIERLSGFGLTPGS